MVLCLGPRDMDTHLCRELLSFAESILFIRILFSLRLRGGLFRPLRPRGGLRRPFARPPDHFHRTTVSRNRPHIPRTDRPPARGRRFPHCARKNLAFRSAGPRRGLSPMAEGLICRRFLRTFDRDLFRQRTPPPSVSNSQCGQLPPPCDRRDHNGTIRDVGR